MQTRAHGTASDLSVSPLPASLWQGRIPGLDGVRALSILLVMLSHLGFMGARPGGFGVMVFFVLSGYLIASLLIREHHKTGSIRLSQFYFRRTLRIFPSMYVTMFTCLLLEHLHVLRRQASTTAVIFEGLYLQNYIRWWSMVKGLPGSFIRGTGQFWSLCVEEHFYLIFPLLLLFLLRRRLRFAAVARVLVVLCFCVLAWRLVVAHTFPLARWYCYLETDCRLDAILWGCVMAAAENDDHLRGLITYRRLLAVLPLSLCVLVLTFVFHAAGQITYNYTVQAIALLPLLYFVSHFPDRVWTRPLNHPVLVHIGVLSYSLYLVHSAVIEIVSDHLHAGRWLLWPVCGLASYVAALALHWLVEKPFLAWRDRNRGHAEARRHAVAT